MIIHFSPALPCANRVEQERVCSQPATAGVATQIGAEWRLMPVCRACTARWQALYEGTGPEGQEKEHGRDE